MSSVSVSLDTAADAEAVWSVVVGMDDWVEAIEAIHSVERLDDGDGVRRRSDLQYALGLDWSGIESLFLNVQWLQLMVLGHDGDLAQDRVRSFASLLLRADLRQETLFPQLFVMVGTDAGDAMIRPSVEWRATDRFSVVLGADVFTGRRDSLFGQYAHDRGCVSALAPGGCLFDSPPGRTSRVFVRFRFEFASARSLR